MSLAAESEVCEFLECDLIGLGWWLFWSLPFTRSSQSQQ